MTNTTPILALDIDGPLNPRAGSKAARRALKRDGFRPITRWQHLVTRPPGSRWFPLSELWLAREHGEMLAEFSTTHDVELVWCSLWEANASRVVSPALGLPRLPYVDFHGHPAGSRFWKFPAVEQFAAGRPLAWLDDSHNEKASLRRASGFDKARRNLPTLCLDIDPDIGLTWHDLQEVASWLHTARLAW